MIWGRKEKKILSFKNIIYSPNVILLNNSKYFFYSGWNKRENSKIKIIKLLNKKISKINSFFKNNINISEPCSKIFKKYIFIFYEFRKSNESRWNVLFTSVKLVAMTKYLK